MRIVKNVFVTIVLLILAAQSVLANELTDALGEIWGLIASIMSFEFLGFTSQEITLRGGFGLIYFIIVYIALSKVPLFTDQKAKNGSLVLALVIAGFGVFFTPISLLSQLGILFPLFYAILLIAGSFWLLYKAPFTSQLPTPVLHVFRIVLLGIIGVITVNLFADDFAGSLFSSAGSGLSYFFSMGFIRTIVFVAIILAMVKEIIGLIGSLGMRVPNINFGGNRGGGDQQGGNAGGGVPRAPPGGGTVGPAINNAMRATGRGLKNLGKRLVDWDKSPILKAIEVGKRRLRERREAKQRRQRILAERERRRQERLRNGQTLPVDSNGSAQGQAANDTTTLVEEQEADGVANVAAAEEATRQAAEELHRLRESMQQKLGQAHQEVERTRTSTNEQVHGSERLVSNARNTLGSTHVFSIGQQNYARAQELLNNMQESFDVMRSNQRSISDALKSLDQYWNSVESLVRTTSNDLQVIRQNESEIDAILARIQQVGNQVTQIYQNQQEISTQFNSLFTQFAQLTDNLAQSIASPPAHSLFGSFMKTNTGPKELKKIQINEDRVNARILPVLDRLQKDFEECLRLSEQELTAPPQATFPGGKKKVKGASLVHASHKKVYNDIKQLQTNLVKLRHLEQIHLKYTQQENKNAIQSQQFAKSEQISSIINTESNLQSVLSALSNKLLKDAEDTIHEYAVYQNLVEQMQTIDNPDEKTVAQKNSQRLLAQAANKYGQLRLTLKEMIAVVQKVRDVARQHQQIQQAN